MASAGEGCGDNDEIFKQLEKESDEFFDQLLLDAGVSSPSGSHDSKAATPSSSTSAFIGGEPASKQEAVCASPARAGESSARAGGYASVPGIGATQAAAAGSPSSGAVARDSGLPGAAHAVKTGTQPVHAVDFDDAEYEQLVQHVQRSSGRAVETTGDPGEVTEAGRRPPMSSLKSTTAGAAAESSCGRSACDRSPVDPHASVEDQRLHESLSQFYSHHNKDNLANIHLIVEKYQGPGVSHLWAQLANKYEMQPFEAIHMLARTLYLSAEFEQADREAAEQLDAELESLYASVGAGANESRYSLMHSLALERGIANGSSELLRAICFRGIPDGSCTRSLTWRILLGCLPMARHSEWNAISGEKRALYEGYKRDLLLVDNDCGTAPEVKAEHAGGHVPSSDCRKLLQEVEQDVDRTRRDLEFFRRPATRSSLVALLFIYARLNPGVRYVQGMNEIAAILFYVMSSGSSDVECAEADAFWCFSELMAEIKEGFMQVMDDSFEGIHASAGHVLRLLRTYDPELATHLQKSELPPCVWAVRWCFLLFAQDATLPDVVRLWDSFIGDPRRFEFVSHVAFAAVLLSRETLLRAETPFELAEVLHGSPRNADIDILIKTALAVCAFERRAQTPEFPQASALQEITELAHTAAAKAQEVKAAVTRSLHQDIAPVVQEHAGKAAVVAASAAQDSAQALQSWLDDTAPARKEALAKAQTQLSSLWGAVRSTGERIVTERSHAESLEGAASRLTTAGDSAVAAASAVSKRAASAWASAWATSAATSAAAAEGREGAATGISGFAPRPVAEPVSAVGA